jgi:pyruvyltransferase
LASARLVLAGSLHGLILAEAYGVPALLVEQLIDQDLFKYEDYVLGTGRASLPLIRSVKGACNCALPASPDLAESRANLLASFPADLWTERSRE